MITQRLKIGNEWIEVTYNSDKELLEKGSFWREVAKRTKCDVCDKTDISLNMRVPKGFSYYGLKCNDCGADINFGQVKATGEFFLRWDNKFTKYDAEAKPEELVEDTDKVPF